ncbi:MAG: tRNA adenosine(34) deaminase TadA [Gammaproteobacteria bacterium]|nr:tRNA adenosine(34) deaminase TadA [Gammaproteobacteria bacterium]
MSVATIDDEAWMRHALGLAQHARDQEEVPVGAVLVMDNQLVAEGWNQPIRLRDPTAHAEIIALREAARSLDNYRLAGTTLYVTLEPCPMCAGALVHARVDRVVFGAKDPRAGAGGSIMNLLDHQQLNHRITISSGVLANESAVLLQEFFRLRR